jgi:hypothetical protein
MVQKKIQQCCKNENLLYICSVRLSLTNLYKTVISFLLLGLFIAIHVVKVFHSHAFILTPISNCEDKLQGYVIKSDESCAVCDFHFSKDTVHTRKVFSLGTSEYPAPCNFINTAFTVITSIGSVATDRGPPTLFLA